MGLNKQQRPELSRAGHRFGDVVSSTAASTALEPRGVVALNTTSTGAPVVYTFARAPKVGDEVMLCVESVASSSVGPFHVNMGSGIGVGSSSEDMLTLAMSGDGAHLVALSSARWGVVGNNGGTFSTST